MTDDVTELKRRISDLEQEVSDREKDIEMFRNELQSANRRLERLIGEVNQELKTAHSLQRLLVPTELPNIPGFEFSSKFVPALLNGGDYFDIFEHDDRARFGIVVATSSGHLMSALLLSVLLKLTGQMEARRGAEPNTMVKAILAELKSQLNDGDSADLFYGRFDRRNFELSYTLVGDVVGLRHDYSSGELKLLKSMDMPLQKASPTEFKTEVVGLNPRDKLIFCTKGLYEISNLKGEEYGRDRLFRSVHEAANRSVHELRNHILYQAQKFLSGQEPPRDMTVVVSEVKDRVIKLAKK